MKFCFLIFEVIIQIENVEDPPYAEDLFITVYSGRNTTFELPMWDPDGHPIEIFVMNEPAAGPQILQLSNEKMISLSGQRRKVMFSFALSN